MITERQIRGRFDKRHLRKLVEQMLEEDYYPIRNGKKSETPVKWYTLRSGVTVDFIVERVRLHSIEESETGSWARAYGEVKRTYRRDKPEEWQKYSSTPLRLTKVAGKPKTYNLNLSGWNTERIKTETDAIDSWIKGHFLDTDYFMHNNTAVDIHIPWGGRK